MNDGYGIRTERIDGRIRVQGFRCSKGCVASASYFAKCPKCGAEAVAASFSDEGKVWSVTVLRIPNGDFPADRMILYVDLDEGPRVLCEAGQLHSIGDRVRITELGLADTPVVSAL